MICGCAGSCEVGNHFCMGFAYRACLSSVFSSRDYWVSKYIQRRLHDLVFCCNCTVCSSTSTAPPLPATDPRLRRANPARIPPPPDPAMDAGSRPPPPTGAGVRVRAPLVSSAPLPFPSWSSLGGAGVRVGLGGRCWGPKALSLGRKLRSFGAGIEGFGGSPRGWAVWI